MEREIKGFTFHRTKPVKILPDNWIPFAIEFYYDEVVIWAYQEINSSKQFTLPFARIPVKEHYETSKTA